MVVPGGVVTPRGLQCGGGAARRGDGRDWDGKGAGRRGGAEDGRSSTSTWSSEVGASEREWGAAHGQRARLDTGTARQAGA